MNFILKIKLILIYMIGNPCFMSAETFIQGIIAKNLTLTEKGSPYRFGQTTIAAGVTLSIEAGVTLSVDFKNSGTTHYDGFTLLVEGRILAHGTAEKPIQIQGALRILREDNKISLPSIFEYCHLVAPLTYGYILHSTVPLEMTNCTVEGTMYVQMGTNAGWNPEKTTLTRCRFLSANEALSLFNGTAWIEDCEFQGRCDVQVSQLDILDCDFRTNRAKNKNWGLWMNAKNAIVRRNTFEGISEAALMVYYQPFNVMAIRDNTFKDNQIHIQIQVKTDLTNQKDVSQWTKGTLLIEENRFLKFEQKSILVTDADKSADRVATHCELNLKDNFWGSLTSLEIEDSIQDYSDFSDLRVKINYIPIAKK